MSKVSVIMLTYNRDKLVGHMIECILAQTMEDFEFIIVDNGSTDDSGKIADAYREKDGRIRVIHRKQGNIGSGRNTGLDAAIGEYIAFVDDDDHCEKDYLQFLYDLSVAHNADVSICGASWSDTNEKYIMTPEVALVTLLQRKKYNVAFPTKLFRRELFEYNRFLETGKYDDIYLMPRILADASLVAYHGIAKYDFKRHDSNNSAWTQNHKLLTAEILQEYLNVYNARTDWLIEKFPNSTDKWKYFKWSFMLSILEKIIRLELRNCYVMKPFLLEELSAHRQDLLNCSYLLDFEKEWMNKLL